MNNIKRLDAVLKIDGKEIQPDIETFQAEYLNTFLELEKKDCCAMFGERLGIDVAGKDDSNGFSVRIIKKYKSLKTLPKQITVVLSATSDTGTTEMERTLKLSSYKDRNFIRVH